MNNGAKKVNFGEIRLKSISNITPITSRTNSVSNDYEEIDYSDESLLENGIMSIIAENKRILTYQTTEERIAELNELINSIKKDLNQSILVDRATMGTMADINSEEYTKLLQSVDEKSEQIEMLDAYLLQLEQALPLASYTDISYTAEYKEFVETYDNNINNIDYDLLALYNYDITSYINEITRGKSSEEIQTMIDNGELKINTLSLVEYLENNLPEGKTIDDIIANMTYLKDMSINYKYMTEDEKLMYHYLFETNGEESANEYLSLLQNKINQAYGVDLSNNFLLNLKTDDEGNIKENLSNLFGVSGKGLGDGILTFYEGIENALENNEQLTAADYEKIIILQTLQEKTNYLDEVYQFNSSLGNMLPSMATSAIISFFGSPVAGSITASALMGTSAYGNAKHQALTRGNDVVSSTLYGLFVGGSEATLGYFLGKIPGISQTAGLSLNSILQEGLEEATQEWVDAGLQAVILGEDVNWSEIPENARKSFIMGALMSGFTNGGQALISLTIDGNSHNINVEETLEYMAENPDVPIESVPGISEFFHQLTDADLSVETVTVENNVVTNLNEIIKTEFLGYRRVEYLNSIIFKEDSYNIFMERINSFNDSMKAQNLYSFHLLYKSIKTNNNVLDSVATTRLETLNQMYLDYINSKIDEIKNMSQDEAFLYLSSGSGKYGIPQGIFTNLKVTEPEVYNEMKNKLVNKYGFSRRDAERFMSMVNAIGACNYAAEVNAIASYFKDMPDKFEEIFGFPLYKINSKGELCLNDVELLADAYYWGNSQSKEATLFVVDEFGNTTFNEDAIVYNDAGEIDKVMQRGGGISFINEYLQSKTSDLSCTVNIVYSNYNNNYNNTFNSNLDIKENLLERISSGEKIIMGSISSGSNPINYTDMSTNNNSSIAGGHWVQVTGVTDDGVIVSSWGERCLVRFSDLQANAYFDFYSASFSAN